MSTLAIAAALAASSPVAVSDTQVATCTQVALRDNNITEAGARRIQVNATATIDGTKVTFAAGDTFWSLCRRRTQQIALARWCDSERREHADFERRTAALIRRIDSLEARHRTHHAQLLRDNVLALRAHERGMMGFVETTCRIGV